MLVKLSPQLLQHGLKLPPASIQKYLLPPLTTATNRFLSINPKKSTLVTAEEGVHQTMKLSSSWKKKPLFRRQGDVRFKTGLEASRILLREVQRRDTHEVEFLESVESAMECLAPIFDRSPRHAFIAKQILEPERFIQFRVAWIDDTGVMRLNRGYRIQYSSALGPYEGPIHFGPHVNYGTMKSIGFDTVFSNSITGYGIGAAVGGADINTKNKSDAEIQRFCQSYMTELSKYIGPDVDQPGMGMGVGEKEIGYLYGQYKRINVKSSSGGKPFLTTGNPTFSHASGYGLAHFANNMLGDRNQSLAGKRCLIIGSGKVARSLAKSLIEDYDAIPLTFSDKHGFIYEPEGFSQAKFRHLDTIKEDRGASVGRYIMASTSAKYNEGNLFDIPCDLCFPCGGMGSIGVEEVRKLADGGCLGVIEGGHSAVRIAARKFLKNRGLLYGPHTMTLTGSHIATTLGEDATDEKLKEKINDIYGEVKRTAMEFNKRGDLFAGTTLAGFIRLSNAMVNQGAV